MKICFLGLAQKAANEATMMQEILEVQREQPNSSTIVTPLDTALVEPPAETPQDEEIIVDNSEVTEVVQKQKAKKRLLYNSASDFEIPELVKDLVESKLKKNYLGLL